MKALEDYADDDPGFERCADPDCEGHLTTRGGRNTRVECSHCGRAPDEIEEEINGTDDEGET